MKKLLAMFLALTMLFALTACGSTNNGDEKPDAENKIDVTDKNESNTGTTIISQYGYDLSKYAEIDWPTVELTTSAQQAETGSISMMTRFYVDMIQEASQGKVTFKEYWDATLCSGQENYEYIRDGVADYGEVPSNYEYSPFFLYQIAYCIPFTSTDFALNGEAVKLLQDQYPEFQTANEESGVHIVAIRGIENYICPTNQNLTEESFSLDWFKNMRISVGSTFYSKWIEAIGAIPITGAGAAGDYENFMNGVIDGDFLSYSLVCDYQFYEVCKAIVEMDMGGRGSALSCWNLDTWNSFSAEVQTTLQEIAELCVEVYNEKLNEMIDGYADKIYNEYNLNKIAVSDEIKAEWCDIIFANDDYNTMKMWISEAESLGYENAEEMVDALVDCYAGLGYEFPFDVKVCY